MGRGNGREGMLVKRVNYVFHPHYLVHVRIYAHWRGAWSERGRSFTRMEGRIDYMTVDDRRKTSVRCQA